VKVDERGIVRTRPFFWSAAGGVPYKLLKDGQVIKTGKVSGRFRVLSIFSPSFAIFYWPMGFNGSVVNDLTKDLTIDEKPAMDAQIQEAEL